MKCAVASCTWQPLDGVLGHPIVMQHRTLDDLGHAARKMHVAYSLLRSSNR